MDEAHDSLRPAREQLRLQRRRRLARQRLDFAVERRPLRVLENIAELVDRARRNARLRVFDEYLHGIVDADREQYTCVGLSVMAAAINDGSARANEHRRIRVAGLTAMQSHTSRAGRGSCLLGVHCGLGIRRPCSDRAKLLIEGGGDLLIVLLLNVYLQKHFVNAHCRLRKLARIGWCGGGID